MGISVVRPSVAPLPVDEVRANRPHLSGLIDELDGAGALNRRGITAELENAADPVRLAQVQELSRSLFEPPADVSGKDLGSAPAERSGFRKILDSMVIGQESAKTSLERFMDSLKSGLSTAPKSLVIGGPPGVGKTEMARAVAMAVHGDPDKVAVVECNQINNVADLAGIFGARAGYAGYSETNEASALSPSSINKMFGEKRPVVILFDEIDKLGAGASTEFWNSLGSCMQDGKLRLANGEVTDLSNAIFIFTSNAGMERAKSLTGEAQRNEFISAAKAALPQHMVSRLRNFISAEPLTLEDTQKIAGLTVNKGLKEGVRIAADRGDEIQMTSTPEADRLLGEIGLSPEYGARPLKGIIEQLLYPTLGDTAHGALDEEKFELRLKPGVTPRELNTLRARFAATAPSIPDEYSADNFPLELVCVSKQPRFHDYAGSVPHDPDGIMSVLGSGAVGGRGYLAMNANPDDPASPNRLLFLDSGPTEAQDRFIDAALPPELARANASLDTVPLDEHRLFLSGVHMGAGELGETSAYIYDTRDKSYTAVAPPPLPLVGAGVGPAGGKVLMVGGRLLNRENGNWAVSLDAVHNNGKPISDLSFRYDPETNAWDTLDATTSTPRSGYSVVEQDGKTFLIGGEELRRQPNGVFTSVSSRNVDVFNHDDLSISRTTELPTPVAYGSSYIDENGRIQVMGGADFVNFGREISPKGTHIQLDPAKSNPAWKGKEALPAEGAQFAMVPHAAGHVVGPFYTEGPNGFEPNFQLLG